MRTFDREPRSARPGKPVWSAKHHDTAPLANEVNDSTTQAMLHLQSTVGNQAVLRMLRTAADAGVVRNTTARLGTRQKGAFVRREPHPDAGAGTQAPAQKQSTLKSEGKDAKDPVYKDTAQIVDTVLARNQRLAPFIGDRLKSTKITEKGKFVQEVIDGNFDDAFRKAYDLNSADTVPSDIKGFYDPRSGEIHLRPNSEFGTALHEAVHKIAAPALYSNYLPTANKISKDLMEVLKEGVTAYFTDGILHDEGLPDFVDAYSTLKDKAKKLVTALGSDGFDVLARFNFKGGIVELGEKMGVNKSNYAQFKGNLVSEILKRLNDKL